MDEDDIDPLPDDIFDKAEREKQNSVSTQKKESEEKSSYVGMVQSQIL